MIISQWFASQIIWESLRPCHFFHLFFVFQIRNLLIYFLNAANYLFYELGWYSWNFWLTQNLLTNNLCWILSFGSCFFPRNSRLLLSTLEIRIFKRKQRLSLCRRFISLDFCCQFFFGVFLKCIFLYLMRCGRWFQWHHILLELIICIAESWLSIIRSESFGSFSWFRWKSSLSLNFREFGSETQVLVILKVLFYDIFLTIWTLYYVVINKVFQSQFIVSLNIEFRFEEVHHQSKSLFIGNRLLSY